MQDNLSRLKQDIFRYFKGSYTDTEKDQINKIKNLYTKYFDNKIPEAISNIDFNKNERKNINSETCEIRYWENMLGLKFNSCIKEEFINIICIYESQRLEQNRGYKDDPTHIFLYELKLSICSITNKSPQESLELAKTG